MKKTKLLSLLLCLSLVCTLFVSGTTAYAEGESNPGDGMKIDKTATVNNDGSTTITLEAFATGSKVITTQTEDVPTDIILVIDQSGSMKEEMGQSQVFVEYKDEEGYFQTTYHTRNQDYYKYRHNGGSNNLWHKLSDGSYVSVSVERTQEYTAYPGSTTNATYYSNRNNLYEQVGGEYKRVSVKSSYVWSIRDYSYTYTFSDGSTATSNGESGIPNLNPHGPLYTPDNVYTYTYTDAAGAGQTIGRSIGDETVFQPAFYKKTTATITRLEALKIAVTGFADAVAEKAAGKDKDISTTEDNVDHRIAVVGFASGKKYNGTTYNYSNTEVFVGSKQYTYGAAAQGQYGSAFQRMNTSGGINNINASIAALAADGGTMTDLGLEMANGIFNANPVPQGTKRNRVVVLFTDGVPGWSGYDSDVANKAITQANTAKNTYGATVYSVGIFPGANATSAGSSNGNDTEKANWFMQNVSSNNGTPRTPSYYLSARDSDALNNIFQQISSNIQTGGSGTTLGSETVVKDIISPYFTLPDGASTGSIRLDTYACTGKDGDTYTWSSNSSGNGGARASVNGDTVSVTGFNFSENWCGTETDTHGNTTVRGKKLVISFEVQPKDGFLGGNGVPTNTSAGIYENANAEKPVKEFPIPTVNVPIQPVNVTAQDKNVYLLGTVTEEQLKNGAEVKCGNVPLKLNEANYGLEEWQTKFVEITTTVTPQGSTNLTDDTPYTISVTVGPKPDSTPSTEGTPATEKTGEKTAKINVFKPELTFKDTEAYYGADVPTNLEGNRTKTEWKHGDTTDASVTMIGDEPNLTITCAPDGSKILNGTINTTDDIGVKATVKIGNTDVTNYTTFKHTNCANQNCTVPNDYHFLIHVKTCTLTVKKELAAGTAIDDGQSFIFTITGPGIAKRVVIQGEGFVTLKGLKVGTYTVTEDTAWSWRYTPQGGAEKTATLSADMDSDEVTFVNTLEKEKWVSTDVYCKNEFKDKGTKTIINGSGKTVNGVPATN